MIKVTRVMFVFCIVFAMLSYKPSEKLSVVYEMLHVTIQTHPCSRMAPPMQLSPILKKC